MTTRNDQHNYNIRHADPSKQMSVENVTMHDAICSLRFDNTDLINVFGDSVLNGILYNINTHTFGLGVDKAKLLLVTSSFHP